MRTLGLEAKVTGHGLSIAATQLAIAGSVEVQTVGTVGAVVAGDDLTGVDGLRQLVNLLLATDADTLAVGLYDVAHIEIHLLGFQLQVAAEVVVNLLHHASPLRIAGVRLALMHQDALDDAVLLGLLGQRDQSLVGVVVVGLQHALHPRWGLLDIALYAVGQESLDVDAADSHVDDANFNIVGRGGHHRAAKPVGRCQAGVGTAERSRGLTPFAHLTTLVGEVNGGHQQEARPWAGQVLSLRTGITLHV